MKYQGLKIGDKAPPFKIKDIEQNWIVLEDILQEHHGLMIDIFRGTW